MTIDKPTETATRAEPDYATVTATSLHCLCCGWLTPIADALTDWEGSGDALECGFCGAMFAYGQRTGYRLQCGRHIPEGQHNHRRFMEART